jgi:ABC-type methionine transport system permease subunit
MYRQPDPSVLLIYTLLLMLVCVSIAMLGDWLLGRMKRGDSNDDK